MRLTSARVILAVCFAILFVGSCAEPAKIRLPWTQTDNGQFCKVNDDCKSRKCVDNPGKCAPENYPVNTEGGNYCHHDNHCASKTCRCEKGAFGFCKEWEKWPAGQYDAADADKRRIGRCAPLALIGSRCEKNENCARHVNGTVQCVQGRCAPKDGLGRRDDYCHHNNHCASGVCRCPLGRKDDLCVGHTLDSRVFAYLPRKTGFVCR